MKLTGPQFTDAVARRLREARGIEVRHREGFLRLGTRERDVFARRLKSHLGRPPTPDELRRLAYPPNLHVYWQSPPTDVAAPRSETFAGEICVFNLAVALTKNDFSSLDTGGLPELEALAEYRILDEHPRIGEGHMTVIRPTPAGDDVELFYLVNWVPYRLALSFEEYHWCLTVTLGYLDWQLLFCPEPPPRTTPAARKKLRATLEKRLHQIWPDADLGEFFALADRAAPARRGKKS